MLGAQIMCLTAASYLSTIASESSSAMKRSTKTIKRAAADKRAKRVLADKRKDTNGSC